MREKWRSRKSCIRFLSIFLLIEGIVSPLWAGWRKLNSGVTVDLYDVCFPNNPNTGYVVGDSGTILYTYNGGEHWAKVKREDIGIIWPLYAVHFPVNMDTGYVVGGGGIVLKAFKREGLFPGEWRILLQTGYPLYAVYFTHPDTGYIGSEGDIQKTTDGGKTWSEPIMLDWGWGEVREFSFPTLTQAM